ncbi:hypothetical protein L3i20_v243770 [Paenibacillus sp. L3-i20]|nr:hypothetical protein L3i20_v243770 [Paenibacillus sp. L3-i20]
MDTVPKEIEGITSEDLQMFIESMYNDFDIIEQNKDCELEVYHFEQIIEYINLSKAKAISVIQGIFPKDQGLI